MNMEVTDKHEIELSKDDGAWIASGTYFRRSDGLFCQTSEIDLDCESGRVPDHVQEAIAAAVLYSEPSFKWHGILTIDGVDYGWELGEDELYEA